MEVTYYIRDNNNEYNEFCDKATIKITKNNKTFYAGIQWGTHTPTNVVNFIVVNIDELNFYDWATSLGYEVVLEDPSM